MKEKITYNFQSVPSLRLPGQIRLDNYYKFCLAIVNASKRSLTQVCIVISFNEPAKITKTHCSQGCRLTPDKPENEAWITIPFFKRDQKVNIDISVGNWDEGKDTFSITATDDKVELVRSRWLTIKKKYSLLQKIRKYSADVGSFIGRNIVRSVATIVLTPVVAWLGIYFSFNTPAAEGNNKLLKSTEVAKPSTDVAVMDSTQTSRDSLKVSP